MRPSGPDCQNGRGKGECRECEEKFPQNIPIVEQLRETEAALGEEE